MSCTCAIVCRLPGRCARNSPSVVASFRADLVEPPTDWERLAEDLVQRIAWVMPETALLLRAHLSNRPRDGT